MGNWRDRPLHRVAWCVLLAVAATACGDSDGATPAATTDEPRDQPACATGLDGSRSFSIRIVEQGTDLPLGAAGDPDGRRIVVSDRYWYAEQPTRVEQFGGPASVASRFGGVGDWRFESGSQELRRGVEAEVAARENLWGSADIEWEEIPAEGHGTRLTASVDLEQDQGQADIECRKNSEGVVTEIVITPHVEGKAENPFTMTVVLDAPPTDGDLESLAGELGIPVENL